MLELLEMVLAKWKIRISWPKHGVAHDWSLSNYMNALLTGQNKAI